MMDKTDISGVAAVAAVRYRHRRLMAYDLLFYFTFSKNIFIIRLFIYRDTKKFKLRQRCAI